MIFIYDMRLRMCMVQEEPEKKKRKSNKGTFKRKKLIDKLTPKELIDTLDDLTECGSSIYIRREK